LDQFCCLSYAAGALEIDAVQVNAPSCDELESLTLIVNVIFFCGGSGIEEECVCCSGDTQDFLSQNAYDGDLVGTSKSQVSGMGVSR